MNVIIVSPSFPHTYWNFADRMRKNGANVLAIGDASYDSLDGRLKDSLTEYYKVSSLSSYDEMFRAVAFFSFKHGKIDIIESNNEFYLLQDAQLREDFNIKSGAGVKETERYKSKSEMKKYYRKANIPSAESCIVKDKKGCLEFIACYGYPVIAKPDIGVGANRTYKIKNEADLDNFFLLEINETFVMEEFIDGDIFSYDAIIDSRSNPLFESMTVWPPSIMDIVNNETELAYYVSGEMDEDLRAYGRAAVKAFSVFSRFVHLEFFRLKKDCRLGKKGSLVALEANMRPAGGYTPDMIDYAHGVDVYKMWADMMLFDTLLAPIKDEKAYSAYAGRRDKYTYLNSKDDIFNTYKDKIVQSERMPGVLVGPMGDESFTVKVGSKKEALEFINFVVARKHS